MKFCTECGTQLSDDAVFCTNCGNKTEATVESARDETPVSVSVPIYDAPAEPTEASSDVSGASEQPQQQSSQPGPSAQTAAVQPEPPAQSEQPTPPPVSPVSQPVPAAFPPVPPPPMPQSPSDPPPPEGSRYNPISAWGYVGIFLVLAIPVVGLVFTIVWACGGCRKVNKRNLARGVLLLYLLAVIVAVIVAIIVVAVTGAAFWPLIQEMLYY